MATAGETKVKSPPKLELGREPPSEEALAAECFALMRIAARDDDDTPLCGATGDGARQPDDGEPCTRGHELEEEDFNFDFLRYPRDDDGD